MKNASTKRRSPKPRTYLLTGQILTVAQHSEPGLRAAIKRLLQEVGSCSGPYIEVQELYLEEICPTCLEEITGRTCSCAKKKALAPEQFGWASGRGVTK